MQNEEKKLLNQRIIELEHLLESIQDQSRY